MLTPTNVSRRHLTCTDLVAHSLRLRPGQIIVGDAHDGETAALLDAWSTGLQGSEPTFRPDMLKQP